MKASLKRLLPPPPPSAKVDWATVEGKLGLKLPADFKTFVDLYGSGKIDDFLMVFTPNGTEHVNLLEQIPRQAKALADLRAYGIDVPHPVYPEANGLIPWGVTDNGDILLWLAKGQPDSWPVVIYSGSDSEFCTFEGALTAFLEAVLSGAHACPAFPRSFPSKSPSFHALATV